MESRSQEILFGTISEYIRTGEPVSSQLLFKKYCFGIKPASIRAELNELEEGGWLSQAHISGGRVPTDKSFELFAQSMMARLKGCPVPKNSNELAQNFLHGELESFIEDLSDEIHALGVVFSLSGGAIFRSGLDELFARLDIDDSSVYKNIARDFEALDENISKNLKKSEIKKIGPRIFIGERNPFIKSEHVAAIFDIFYMDDGKYLICTINPKRMDYEKNFRIFLGLEEAIKNSH